MRRCTLLALLLPLVLLHPATAADAKPDLAANAALKYWQAFAQMPTLDKDQEKLLGDWNKSPLDKPARDLILASEKSRLYLHRAAKLPRCDWGLDYEDGMELLLPYLARSRDLARLAALHARHELEQGRRDAGVADAVAMLTMARHVGNEPMMICMLVRYLIEMMAIELVAAHLPELEALGPKVLTAYEALPQAATLPQAFLAEKTNCIEWLIVQMRDAEKAKKGSWRDVLTRAIGSTEAPEVVKEIGTYERAMQLLEGVPPVSDQLAKLVALPPAELNVRYPEFKKKTKADNLLASHLISGVEKMLEAQRRNQVQVAMLRAATAVVAGGPDKIKDSKDPFGDGPFEYRAQGKGFELKSKLNYNGLPVTLKVGR